MLSIAEERRRQKMTQVALARAAHVSQPSLSDIENGRVVPRVDTVQRIARALGCTVDELLCEEDGDEKQGG